MFKYAFAIMFTLFAATPAYAGSPSQCAPLKAALEQLKTNYNEEVTWTGGFKEGLHYDVDRVSNPFLDTPYHPSRQKQSRGFYRLHRGR